MNETIAHSIVKGSIQFPNANPDAWKLLAKRVGNAEQHPTRSTLFRFPDGSMITIGSDGLPTEYIGGW